MIIRGGIPKTVDFTVTDAGGLFVRGPTVWISLKNIGSEDVTVYWSKADMTADVNGFILEPFSARAEKLEGLFEVMELCFKTGAGKTTRVMGVVGQRVV